MLFMQKQLPCLMLSLCTTVITQILVSLTRKLIHMTVENSKGPLFTLHNYCLSALLTRNSEYLFPVHNPNFSLTDEKCESCIQDKCQKPHSLANFFSRTCLSKTIYDIADFIKAISCSEITNVFIKQKLTVIYASFQYLSKENATNDTK